MDIRVLRRPAHDLLSSSLRCSFAANLTARRHESTFRRTKKKLNVKPDASFLNSRGATNQGHNILGRLALQQDHIIFNPPSSQPSVLHTPLVFLPKDDKRRQLIASAETSKGTPSGSRLPPLVSKPKAGYQRNHLSEEDVAEMRRLRMTDPETWSVLKLAKKFNCSSVFIRMCCQAHEKGKQEELKLEAVKARWGPKRKRAREDRVKRRELIYRDE